MHMYMYIPLQMWFFLLVWWITLNFLYQYKTVIKISVKTKGFTPTCFRVDLLWQTLCQNSFLSETSIQFRSKVKEFPHSHELMYTSQTRPCLHYAHNLHLFLEEIYMFFNYVWMNPVLSNKRLVPLHNSFSPVGALSGFFWNRFRSDRPTDLLLLSCFIFFMRCATQPSACAIHHHLIENIDLSIKRDEGKLNYDLLSLKLPLWFLAVGIKSFWRVIAVGVWMRGDWSSPLWVLL